MEPLFVHQVTKTGCPTSAVTTPVVRTPTSLAILTSEIVAIVTVLQDSALDRSKASRLWYRPPELMLFDRQQCRPAGGS